MSVGLSKSKVDTPFRNASLKRTRTSTLPLDPFRFEIKGHGHFHSGVSPMIKTVNLLTIGVSDLSTTAFESELVKLGDQCDIRHAQDASAMLAELDDHEFDIIVCCHVMPNFSALEALQILNERSSDVPLIVVFDEVCDEAALQAIRAGARACLARTDICRLGAVIEREIIGADLRRSRRETDQELYRIRDIFKHLTDNITDVFWIRSADMKKLYYVSPAYDQIWGRPVNFQYTKPSDWIDQIVPGDRKRVAEAYDALMADAPTIDVEYQILRADGGTRWIRTRGFQVRDAEGTLIRLTGIVTDITSRKNSENELRLKEERLRLLFNQIKDGFYQSTPDGRLVEINPAMIEMFGYSSREDMLKADVKRDLYFSPEDRKSRTLDEGRETPEIYRMRRKDGSAIWVEDRGQYKYDEEGNVLMHQGVLRDVTERRLAEERLMLSEERYRDLVENAHDIIFSHDLDGKYTSINKAGELITGYTHDEILGLNISETVAPEDVAKLNDEIRKLLTGQHRNAYELELLGKDGRRIAVELNAKLVLHDGIAVGIQGIARDITERKLLEKQLAQAQKLESIGRLAGGIAHDFNNMLTAINGYSELTLRRMKDGDPLKNNIEEIKKAGERSALLTNQLLAFSRQQMLMPVVLDINEVISDITHMLQRLIGEDVQLVAMLKPNVGHVKVDAGQLSQIIMNLSVNSRDAMTKGGTLTIETANVFLNEEYTNEHFGVLPGAYVVISVSDTGEGMDRETRSRMFEPFFTTKEVGKGTGLGLATVYGIVKQSGGNVIAYSEPGHGTTVKVYLPRVVKEGESVAADAALKGSVLSAETILLVEDEPIVRNLSRQILESSGFKVIEASNGAEALELFRTDNPEIDLLLTDVIMPEMGGRELAEQLKRRVPGLPVLFTSGYTDDAVMRHGFLETNSNFIQKPFTANSLSAKVRSVLELSK